jgi:hypothetical protein
MIKGVSKHIGLDRLLQIKQDNCLGESGQEYCVYELDDMINARMQSVGEREYQEYLEMEAGRHASEFIDDGMVTPEMFFSSKPAFFVKGQQLLISKRYMRAFQLDKQYVFHVYKDGYSSLVTATSTLALIDKVRMIDVDLRVEYVGTRLEFENEMGMI